MLKNSGGLIDRLPSAIALARRDWCDALFEAGFAWMCGPIWNGCRARKRNLLQVAE